MNKKHVISTIAVALILVLVLGVLVACNKYEWEGTGPADSSKPVESNGGYYVRQGDYAFIVNGYDTNESIDNSWGTPVKNGIVRVKINADGSLDNSTATVIVPKQVYNSYANGGIAVYGEWVYYATPNTDSDKNGTASTTHTDFMRTKTDGSVTQLIITVNSRSSEYFFTESRILFYQNSAIEYVDFSGMSGKKSSDNMKGVTTGTLATDVSSVQWNYGSDYVVYTKNETGDTSYEFCNYIYTVKANGEGGEKLVADKYTYLTDAEKANYVDYFPTKVFSYSLKGSYVESDGKTTIYYTKSNYINSTTESTGLYCTTIGYGEKLDATREKHLTFTDPTAIYALGYEKGALVTMSNKNVYLVSDNANDASDVYKNIVIGKSVTVQAVAGGTVYYSDSDGTKIYAINLVANEGKYTNETVVLNAKFNASWLKLDFAGNRLYFFDSNDYNYVHYVDLGSYAGKAIDETTFVGIMNQADLDAKEAAEK